MTAMEMYHLSIKFSEWYDISNDVLILFFLCVWKWILVKAEDICLNKAFEVTLP